jgi:hypothetical protein
MSRWLSFVVSCCAAIGIACGGDSGDGGDTFDARPTADAVAPTPDARLPDAPPPDARTFDARLDATPTPDAGADAQLVDAMVTPDACVSDPECGGEAGLTCVDGNTEQECRMVAAGCFQLVAGTAEACSENKTCPGVGVGCVCEPVPACADGEGTYCGNDDGTAGTPQGVYECGDDPDDGDECIVPMPADDCTAPQVCVEDAGGDAECQCPTAGNDAGDGCSEVNAKTCNTDETDVLRCEMDEATGCVVWQRFEGCAVYDSTDGGVEAGSPRGLVCAGEDCVCPDTGNQKEFFANPVVNRNHEDDEGLHPTGASSPAICMYPHLYQALQQATFEGFNGAEDTYAVASDASGGGQRPVFTAEPFPLVIGPNVTVTTIDHPRFEGQGGPMRSNWFTIEANSYPECPADAPNSNECLADAFIWLRGGTGSPLSRPGPSLMGFQINVAACIDGSACEYPTAVVRSTGYSPDLGGEAARPNMAFNTINGAGDDEPWFFRAAAGEDDEFAEFSGVFPGGSITAGDDGTFTYTASIAPDPNDPRWTDGADTGTAKGYFTTVPACSGRLGFAVVGAETPANNGFFLHIAGYVNDNTVTLYNPSAVDEDLPEDATVTAFCIESNSVNVGHWNHGASGTYENVNFVGFLNGTGALVEGTHPLGAGAIYAGGLWAANDEGMEVEESALGTEVIVRSAPFGSQAPATFTGNFDDGIDINGAACSNITFGGTGLIVQNTVDPDSSPSFSEATGEGITINGNPEVTLTGVTSSGNGEAGLEISGTSGQAEECAGAVTVTDSTFSTNGLDGVMATGFSGVVTLLGGTYTGNGSETWGALNVTSGNGILVNGCIHDPGADFTNADDTCLGGFFVGASAAEGDASRPKATNNKRAGIKVRGSAVYISNTDITGNGTANVCTGPERAAGLESREAGLVVTKSGSSIGVAHVSDSTISNNHGAGARVATMGDDAGRPTTFDDVQINGNEGIHECDFDPDEGSRVVNDEPEPVDQVAGLHIRPDSEAQVVNGTLNVDENDVDGVYVNGYLRLIGGDRNTEFLDDEDAPITESDGTLSINDNQETGLVVGPKAVLVEISGGTITGNSADPNDPGGGILVVGNDSGNDTRVEVSGETEVSGNTGTYGVKVDTDEDGDQVVFDNTVVSGNTGSGFLLLRAPGDPGQPLTDVPLEVVLNTTANEYGVLIRDSEITGNTGDGITAGDEDPADADLLAMIQSNEIHTNLVGVRIQGGVTTGVSMDSNRILNNTESGVVLDDAILVPIVTSPGPSLGLGFLNNSVFNNGFAPDTTTCTSPQSHPQILLSGTTASTDAIEFCAAQTEGTECEDADGRDGINWHCARPSSQAACVAVHDLRGGIDDCSASIQNSIYGYNTTDDAVTGRSIAILSVDGGQANANINDYGSATGAENTDVEGGGGFILNNVNPCMVLSCGR